MRNSEYDRYWASSAIFGVILLALNIYYFEYGFWREMGATNKVLDIIVSYMLKGKFLASPYKTKILALFFLGLSAFGFAKKKHSEDNNWPFIFFGLTAGAALYLAPITGLNYIFMTISGAILVCSSLLLAGKYYKTRFGLDKNGDNTFEQCESLIVNEYSINIPTVYRYKDSNRKGWINVVNPFRATMVLGTPGSGKSYSVYNSFIEQMSEKGFSMFVYDYKFPDLTEVVYNEVLNNIENYEVKPKFYVINFNDPRYSHRCNPINPVYLDDPADATEIAELVMRNINKSEEREDFFSMSAKVYLDALVWFLKIYEGGKYCTFPHVIELMGQDYNSVFAILSDYQELEVKIKPFINALKGGAQDQLQGQIASAQIPLNKFVSPALYWVLSGDDFTLDINNPEAPKIVCVGNDPDRQTIYGTTLALLTSRMFKLINHKHKLHSGVLLDELPTIFIKGLDNLIATARSNKVAIVLGAQDKSQLRRDYGDKESEVIFNTVGNIFSGQVNGKTAEDLSRSFGKEFREQRSHSEGGDSESTTLSLQLQEILPASRIETLSQGTFFGKVADNFDQKIDKKLFCSEIQIDKEASKAKKKSWQRLPLITEFPDDDFKKIIEENYMKIKKEVQSMIQKEIERISESEKIM